MSINMLHGNDAKTPLTLKCSGNTKDGEIIITLPKETGEYYIDIRKLSKEDFPHWKKSSQKRKKKQIAFGESRVEWEIKNLL